MMSITVLVIEDEQPMADALGLMFSEYVQSGTGSLWVCWEMVKTLAEGIARLAQQPKVDVCLLDLNLPNGQGVSTLLRLLHASPETPVVVLTGEDSEELEQKCRGLGRADDYIRKSALRLVRGETGTVDNRDLVWRLHAAAKRYEARSQMAVIYREHLAKIEAEKLAASEAIMAESAKVGEIKPTGKEDIV